MYQYEEEQVIGKVNNTFKRSGENSETTSDKNLVNIVFIGDVDNGKSTSVPDGWCEQRQ